MEKVVLDTNRYYSVFVEEEDEQFYGEYGELISKYPNADIFYDDELYSDDKYQFVAVLKELIRKYEARYKTSVYRIVLAGSVGTWQGNRVGGRIVHEVNNILSYMGQVDDIRVVLEEDGTINIYGYHHDGVHCMDIYFITESCYDRLNSRGIWDTYLAYEWIVDNRSAVRLPKSVKYWEV